MRRQPFWVDDHPRPDGLTSELPTETDLLIVGSGLTGLSAALRTSGAGVATTVIDAGPIGSGASSRNGGMVSPDVKGGVDTLWKRYGEEYARGAWDSSVRSVELVRTLAKDPRISATIAEGGMTGVSSRPGQLKKYQATVRWYREKFGVAWEVLDRDQVGRFVGGTDRFSSGFHEPEGFGIQPAELTFGLAAAVRDSGAMLIAECEALSVDRRGKGYEIHTSQGPIRAGHVFVATNGYTTTNPEPNLAKKVVPVGSYIIVTAPLEETAAESLFPTNSMSYTSRRLLNYMRRTADNRILIGGRRNLRTGLDLNDSAADLRQQLVGIWPQLNDVPITHVWGGRLGVTFDLAPHMGEINGVAYAMGYGGHGVGLAAQLGHEFAGNLLGEDPPSVFSSVPHRGRWYYRGRPWFLTPASVMYRTLDRFGM